MKVIVEFFSSSPIENVLSILAARPDLAVFLGDAKRMKKQSHIYQRFLEETDNTQTKIEYRPIRVHELHEIVNVVESVVRDYPQCHFDLTGGDSLAMTAIGIIYERHKDKGIELHQYNVNTGKVYDCDLDGTTLSSSLPALTVRENIVLHGGTIVDSSNRESGSYDWSLTEDFENDIYRMWDICKVNCGLWNTQVTMLGEMTAYDQSEDELSVKIAVEDFRQGYKQTGGTVNLKGILPRLENIHVLSTGMSEPYYEIEFKNEQIKRCLSKAGTLLELYTLISAGKITDKNGNAYYNDAMTGVFIDWDGIVHDPTEQVNESINEQVVDTENEIDVVLMHGVVPVFISCKNGAVGDEELYKLNTVAHRFGNKYVKKVLVATTLGKHANSRKYFLERAKEMKITVVENVHEMTAKEFEKKLKSLA